MKGRPCSGRPDDAPSRGSIALDRGTVLEGSHRLDLEYVVRIGDSTTHGDNDLAEIKFHDGPLS